jgi:SulP family sulfate permease
LFLAKTSTPNIPTLGMDIDELNNKRALVNVQKKPVKQCPQLKIIRIDMSVYFGSINHIQTKINQISENERIYNILIIGTRINFIDLSGAEMLVQEHRRLKKLGGGLYFCDLNAEVYEFAARTCFISHVGNHHFFDSKKDAIGAIYHSLDKDVCQTCSQLAFRECN